MSKNTFGQLPAVTIRATDGAQATVTLYGGHLVSWRGSDGRERLFCSRESALDGSRAIRGGVPVIFPQFGARGAGMRHDTRWPPYSVTVAWAPSAARMVTAGSWPKRLLLMLVFLSGHAAFRQRRIFRKIVLDAGDDGVGHLVLVAVVGQLGFFFRIGDEGGLDQDGGDVGRFHHGIAG